MLPIFILFNKRFRKYLYSGKFSFSVQTLLHHIYIRYLHLSNASRLTEIQTSLLPAFPTGETRFRILNIYVGCNGDYIFVLQFT